MDFRCVKSKAASTQHRPGNFSVFLIGAPYHALSFSPRPPPPSLCFSSCCADPSREFAGRACTELLSLLPLYCSLTLLAEPCKYKNVRCVSARSKEPPRDGFICLIYEQYTYLLTYLPTNIYTIYLPSDSCCESPLWHFSLSLCSLSRLNNPVGIYARLFHQVFKFKQRENTDILFASEKIIYFRVKKCT